MTTGCRIRAAACAALLLAVGAAAAQPTSGAPEPASDKTLAAVRADVAPIIDGVMDEVWAEAALLDDLHQLSPTEYATPTEKTVVRVLYDDDFLYVSGMMYFEDPDDIVTINMIQGLPLFREDRFRVYINPFDDGRNGYVFTTNVNGMRFEGIVENVTGINFDWSGIWYAGSQRTDYGWFAEVAIPFKTLSFDPDNSSWGLSVLRTVEHNNEEIAWTSFNRDVEPSNYGTLTNLEGMQQGMGLDVIPGASATYRRLYNPGDSESELEPTLDAFYRFTPNLTGALTINSDFSATDVDARQVQLTRFSLFFPEQRKFFLQEADIFEFGGLDDNGRPFFSRRIGIGPSGEELDLEIGGKLTGRVGRWNIGALAVQQDGNAGDVPDGGRLVNPSDLFVGRLSANVLEQSTVGAIVTHGNPTGDLDNSLVGVDFNYLNTHSFDNVSVDSQIWYQQSDTEGVDDDQSAWGIKVRSPNSTGWRGKYEYNYIGENFNPALGFVNRRGVEKNEAGLGYVKRYDSDALIRSWSTFAEWIRFTDLDGRLESETLELSLADLEYRSGEFTGLYWQYFREVLDEPFEIADGVVIPVGDYSFDTIGAYLFTAQRREFSTEVYVEQGGFYDGDIRTANLEFRWAANQHFTGQLEFQYNDIDLPGGNFETRLLRLRTDVAFNPEWAWITTAQYDNQSDVFGINSRLQWIPAAGREFYLIYNGGWLDDPLRNFEKIGESATVRLTHTFRF